RRRDRSAAISLSARVGRGGATVRLHVTSAYPSHSVPPSPSDAQVAQPVPLRRTCEGRPALAAPTERTAARERSPAGAAIDASSPRTAIGRPEIREGRASASVKNSIDAHWYLVFSSQDPPFA